jgi:hypothetical protein
MADEQQQEQQGEEQAGGKTYTESEVKALLEQETSGLKSKLEELLGESKSAKQKARELEEQQRQAEEQRLAEKQEFKTLYEREQEAKRALQEEHETFKQQVQRSAIDSASTKVAAELTRDSKRGELLAEKAAQFARYTDQGIVYEMGGVEVDKAKVLEHLRTEYPFLVDGNQSSGGGATGNTGGGAARKPLKDMSQAERAEFKASDPEGFRQAINAL